MLRTFSFFILRIQDQMNAKFDSLCRSKKYIYLQHAGFYRYVCLFNAFFCRTQNFIFGTLKKKNYVLKVLIILYFHTRNQIEKTDEFVLGVIFSIKLKRHLGQYQANVNFLPKEISLSLEKILYLPSFIFLQKF